VLEAELSPRGFLVATLSGSAREAEERVTPKSARRFNKAAE
jgi:hypothetical protein